MLSIVIPAYNEEESIGSIVDGADRAARELARTDGVSGYEILVVDDASTDRTRELAERAASVRVITHHRNRGYGSALKTGFLAARGEVIAFLDADGTYPPEYLGPLCAPIVEDMADMTIAVRDRGRGSGMPVIRRIGNVLFARLLSWIAESPVRDSTSGMRAFRRSALARLFPLSNGLDFIVGLSTRAVHEGLRVAELPIPYAKRQGRSKLRVIKEGFRFLRTFISVAATYNPLKFFGALGLGCALLASYLAIGPVSHYLQFRRVEDWEIYRLITILVLFVIGLSLINFGIIGNRLLALVTGSPVETRSFFGRLFLKRGASRDAWWIGLSLCAAAVALNWRTISEYLVLRSIRVHWSYVFTGALLFLVGAQLLMTAGLLGLFRRVEARLAYRRRLELGLRRGEAGGENLVEPGQGSRPVTGG